MLLRFGVQNHLSIRDRQEIVLTAAKRITRTGRVMPVPILREDAVPLAVVYGANASGKSNLVYAIQEMRRHIEMSHRSWGADDPIPHAPFLLDQVSANKPTAFDCMFTINDHAEQEVYEYGFACTDAEYTHEWLHRVVRRKRQTTQVLFDRKTTNGETHVTFGSRLRGENRLTAALTRPNSLFLSAAAQNNHPQLGAVHRQFAQHWQPLEGERVESELADSLDGFEDQDAFVELMHQADLGVVGFELKNQMTDRLNAITERITGSEPLRSPKRLHFTHASNAGACPMDFRSESRGTQRLAALAIPVLKALSAGQLVIVDELDSSLHHRLAAALVRLFQRATNHRGAQLITTVHDTALLHDELDLDHVWLAEKDNTGASHFTPLTDYRIRSREDIERVYREGRVGGAPIIGDLAVALEARAAPSAGVAVA